MTLRARLIHLGAAHHLTQGLILGSLPEAMGWGYYYPQ